MYVHRDGSGVIVRAPAKVNLFCEILGKRDDGFHELETFMVPLALCDDLAARPLPSAEIRVHCRWAATSADSDPTLGTIPPAEENLVTRALRLLQVRSGTQQGAEVWLLKRIPAEAGLGGGSSDAAAALVAGNLLWNLNWPTEKLAELAAELGSDIPFFLTCSAAICRGRGEQIERVALRSRLHLVLVRPPAGLGTAEVYRACRPAVQPRTSGPLIPAIRQARRAEIQRGMFNRLEDAAASISPWPGRLRRELEQQHGVAAQMSGSGSCSFAVARSRRQARRIASRLRARGLGRAMVTSTWIPPLS